jgi:hypothetical protein
VLIKRDSQRSAAEREEIARGLCRGVLLEAFVFVPVSAILVLIIVRPLVLLLPYAGVFSSEATNQALYGLLGILSYEFPFAVLRRVVVRFALRTLKEFASIAIKEDGLPVPQEAGGTRKGLLD